MSSLFHITLLVGVTGTSVTTIVVVLGKGSDKKTARSNSQATAQNFLHWLSATPNDEVRTILDAHKIKLPATREELIRPCHEPHGQEHYRRLCQLYKQQQ